VRRGWRADQAHRAIALEQHEQRIEIVRRRDRVEDEVEAADVPRHLLGIL